MSQRGTNIAFPTTHWTMIASANLGDSAIRRRAIANILQNYFDPLLHFLEVRLGRDHAMAPDLLQDFIASRILERNLLAGVDRQVGQFRGYLLTSLNNFMISDLRRRSTQRRMPLEGLADGGSLDQVLSSEPTPDNVFEVEWARSVLNQAIEQMKAGCDALGRQDLWLVFEQRMLRPLIGEPAASPDDLAAQLGISREGVSNLLVTGKRRFKKLVEEVVSHYEFDPRRVRDEIADLRRILSLPRKAAEPAAYNRVKECS